MRCHTSQSTGAFRSWSSSSTPSAQPDSSGSSSSCCSNSTSRRPCWRPPAGKRSVCRAGGMQDGCFPQVCDLFQLNCGQRCSVCNTCQCWLRTALPDALSVFNVVSEPWLWVPQQPQAPLRVQVRCPAGGSALSPTEDSCEGLNSVS